MENSVHAWSLIAVHTTSQFSFFFMQIEACSGQHSLLDKNFP